MRVCADSGIGAHAWRQATALALLALLLMPVNYRAGAAYPHGHALIQLVFESQAGVPVHRHGVDQIQDPDRAGDVATSQSGVHAIQITALSALLPLVLLALALQTLRTSIRAVSDTKPSSQSLTPGHPPPQPGAYLTAFP